MTSIAEQPFLDLPAIGAEFEGGYFNGLYVHGGMLRAQISAPKRAGGHHTPTVWHSKFDLVEGALDLVDGAAGTKAMAAAGSELAQWAIELRINGHDDWHLPSILQLDRIYRMAKPTGRKNLVGFLDGMNYSSWPPAAPYELEFPAQTALDLFLPGAAEAFEPHAYWSATQHPVNPSYAYVQLFGNGSQYWTLKDYEFGAVAVRSLILCSFNYFALPEVM